MFWLYDATYILVIIGALISGIASLNVNGTFRKYDKIKNVAGYTGHQVAAHILNSAGIYDVRIERVRGNLTDHYSSGERVLRLSDSVFDSTSVAAIGVAAHECGHAIQHQEGYGLLTLRSVAVPVANFGSWLSWPVILLGMILGQQGVAEIGVVLFLFVVLFQLITLPVEIDASKRAIKILDNNSILVDEELEDSKKVLRAAAYTYVAALFATILQLLRLVLIVYGGSNDKGGRRAR